MAYRNKADTQAEADRLGIDISGMTWAEQQKAVKVGLERERLAAIDAAVTSTEKKPKAKPKYKLAKDYRFRRKLIAPELKPDKDRIIRYTEELGDDLDIEEKSFMGMEGKGGIPFTATRDYTTSTYYIKGKTGRKVIAESSIPKKETGRSFNPDTDWFEVCSYMDKTGYRFSQVKQAIQAAGLWEAVKDEFQGAPNVFYCGNILCCSIPHTHRVLQRVEKLHKKMAEQGEDDLKWVY